MLKCLYRDKHVVKLRAAKEHNEKWPKNTGMTYRVKYPLKQNALSPEFPKD